MTNNKQGELIFEHQKNRMSKSQLNVALNLGDKKFNEKSNEKPKKKSSNF